MFLLFGLRMQNAPVHALSITVNHRECISETVLYAGDIVSGSFVVLDHDIFWTPKHPGIEFIVKSPQGTVVFSLRGTSGDKFQFKAPRSGIYDFCFHNPVGTPEIVSFYIHTGHIPNEEDKGKDGEQFSPLTVKLAELREALGSVTAEQKYLKARDARHRFTNESTRSRVIFYTVAEYLLLAVTSAVQVVYIRRLFGKSIAYNRV
ncbi:hypothetical protein Ancab_020060 [Ancistrocladus abbreviatus]